MAQTPPTLRLFVALPIPEVIRARLAEVKREWGAGGTGEGEGAGRVEGAGGLGGRPFRWARPEGLHVTLLFLGERPAEVVAPLSGALERAAQGRPPLDLAVCGLGCFPDPARPRVLWAGLAGDLEGLDRLRRAIGREVRAAGVSFERQRFRPHVTLGRATAPLDESGAARLRAVLDGPPALFGCWTAEGVELLRSQLGAGGSHYFTIARTSLAGAPRAGAGDGAPGEGSQ